MVVDNHYVRSLLGPDVYWLPKGAPTDEHLRRALLVPQQFDVIAVVEDAAGTDVLVQQGLGWGTLHLSLLVNKGREVLGAALQLLQ